VRALDIFRERLSFEIKNTVPEQIPFRAKLEQVSLDPICTNSKANIFIATSKSD
jgi:hypothetical protein